MKKAMEIGSFDKGIRKLVAMELGASWPVPVESSIIFFYFARFGPPPAEFDQLYPPSWMAWLSAEDGKVQRIEKREPSFYGINGRPDVAFAQHSFPSDWTIETVNQKRDRLFDCMDFLYPQWSYNIAPDARDVADFRSIFPELAAPPMMGCYKHVAPRFFSWIGL
jgi:hypothetical protein